MILIRNNSQQTSFDEDVIHRAALVTLRMHDSEVCEVSVLLANDRETQSLNGQYRDIDAPTDVLAFAMREGVDEPLNPDLLGDLVISVPTAQRQASAHNHSLDVELACLTVHGILHLLGYDHQIPEDAAIMFEKQETLLCLV